MRPAPANSSPPRAFTLIEMVVVVVLIAILAAMIIPEMRGTFDDALLRSTGRDLINVFSLASSRAVSLNQSCRVRLDTQNNRYAVERKTHDGLREDYAPLPGVIGAAGKLDPRITIELIPPAADATGDAGDNPAGERAVPDAVGFYPDGTADAMDIRLRDRAGFQLLLRLNPITAKVHLTGPEHE